MQLFGRDCGCEARKDILSSSDAGRTELIIGGVCVALLLVAWRTKP